MRFFSLAPVCGGRRISPPGAAEITVHDPCTERAARRPPHDVASILFRVQPTETPAPWHFLYFFPEPQGQGSLRPTLRSRLTFGCARCGPSTLGGAESSILGACTASRRRRCSASCSSVTGS